MLDLLFIAAAHAAEPLPVVTLGSGVAAAPPKQAPTPEPSASAGGPEPPSLAPLPQPPKQAPNPGGWIPVLADCLEERASGRYTVVDRSSLGGTLAQIRGHLPEVRALSPAWVVVALGAAELGEPKGARAELEGLVSELGVGRVLLVGLVPSLTEGAEPAAQATLDEQAARWNKLLGEVASKGGGVVHVDLWSQWPKDPAGRAALSTRSGALSEQGLARVAAAVCDAVLAKP